LRLLKKATKRGLFLGGELNVLAVTGPRSARVGWPKSNAIVMKIQMRFVNQIQIN
jgi:hypothetical protein